MNHNYPNQNNANGQGSTTTGSNNSDLLSRDQKPNVFNESGSSSTTTQPSVTATTGESNNNISNNSNGSRVEAGAGTGTGTGAGTGASNGASEKQKSNGFVINPQSPTANMSHPLIPPMPPVGHVSNLIQPGQFPQMTPMTQMTKPQDASSLTMSTPPAPTMSSSSASPTTSTDKPAEIAEAEDEANRMKRPLSNTRRAAQNRSAQKAFRQRKERYIKELEAQAADAANLKQTIEDLKSENLRLRDYTIVLQSRIIELGSNNFNSQSDGGQVYNKMQ